MLPKPQRLNLKKDFKRVASGKKIETKLLKLFIKPGESLGPRVGIALSSKNFKKATDRNRARRLVSQAFQSLYKSLPQGVNIVALPKSGVLSVKSDDIISDLDTALSDYEKLTH